MGLLNCQVEDQFSVRVKLRVVGCSHSCTTPQYKSQWAPPGLGTFAADAGEYPMLGGSRQYKCVWPTVPEAGKPLWGGDEMRGRLG